MSDKDIILLVNGTEITFTVTKDSYISYIDNVPVDANKARKRFCKECVKPDQSEAVNTIIQDNGIAELTAELLEEYLPKNEAFIESKEGDVITVGLRKHLEFDHESIRFNVKQSDALKFSNAIRAKDLYVPYFNFVMSTIEPEDREKLRPWMDYPNTPVLVAQEIYLVCTPDMELFVKKSKGAAKPSKRTTSKA